MAKIIYMPNYFWQYTIMHPQEQCRIQRQRRTSKSFKFFSHAVIKLPCHIIKNLLVEFLNLLEEQWTLLDLFRFPGGSQIVVCIVQSMLAVTARSTLNATFTYSGRIPGKKTALISVALGNQPHTGSFVFIHPSLHLSPNIMVLGCIVSSYRTFFVYHNMSRYDVKQFFFIISYTEIKSFYENHKMWSKWSQYQASSRGHSEIYWNSCVGLC